MNLKNKEPFKIGDTVIVTNVGYCYSTYDRLANKFKAKYWTGGNRCAYNSVGVIKNIGKHLNDDNDATIALVHFAEEKKDILIGIEGIKKIEADLFGEPVQPLRVVS